LHGGEFTIGPDYLEVVSFIGAAAVTHGSITIKNAGIQYLDMVRLVFQRLGVRWENRENDIFVPADQELVVEPDLGGMIPTINVMPWPAFPTDLMSIAIVIGTQAKVRYSSMTGCIHQECSSPINWWGWVHKSSYVILTGALFKVPPSWQAKNGKSGYSSRHGAGIGFSLRKRKISDPQYRSD